MKATVREINGQLVLDDPDAYAMACAVSKHNCKATLAANADRVEHFKRRIAERGESPANVVIVVINVDDPHGNVLAEALMPGHDWQQFRARGEVPFARGLAGREGIESFLDFMDKDAAKKLRETTGAAVVVVDHGVAEVF